LEVKALTLFFLLVMAFSACVCVHLRFLEFKGFATADKGGCTPIKTKDYFGGKGVNPVLSIGYGFICVCLRPSAVTLF